MSISPWILLNTPPLTLYLLGSHYTVPPIDPAALLILRANLVLIPPISTTKSEALPMLRFLLETLETGV